MNTRSETTDEQPVTKLAAIGGRWKFEEGRTVYEGPAPPATAPFGYCVSNVRFLEGEVRVTVQRTDASIETRILLGYRSPLNAPYLAAGIGPGGKGYSITEFVPGSGWRHLIYAGAAQELVGPVKISVKVRGQRILLEVGDVPVIEYILQAPLPYGQLGLFAWGAQGEATFTDFYAKPERGDVFVVMQFSGFEQLYTDVIEPLTKDLRLRPYRADQVYGPGFILADIIRGIETAQIVIAEITPTNENVFYELGYAHALKKPTILLVDREKKKDFPFDLSGYRCLFYQNSIGGKAKVMEELEKHLRAILDE